MEAVLENVRNESAIGPSLDKRGISVAANQRPIANHGYQSFHKGSFVIDIKEISWLVLTLTDWRSQGSNLQHLVGEISVDSL